MPEFPDAGPHATPDQVRAAQKRKAAREAAGGRQAAPEERHAAEQETVADTRPVKRAKKKG